mmetsp:Transcript_418/g.600  ORF Transcript_418/g.600 Transcript_418/m.600 type:complete len:315 (+) Transcript_418:736-1680(+)
MTLESLPFGWPSAYLRDMSPSSQTALSLRSSIFPTPTTSSGLKTSTTLPSAPVSGLLGSTFPSARSSGRTVATSPPTLTAGCGGCSILLPRLSSSAPTVMFGRGTTPSLSRLRSLSPSQTSKLSSVITTRAPNSTLPPDQWEDPSETPPGTIPTPTMASPSNSFLREGSSAPSPFSAHPIPLSPRVGRTSQTSSPSSGSDSLHPTLLFTFPFTPTSPRLLTVSQGELSRPWTGEPTGGLSQQSETTPPSGSSTPSPRLSRCRRASRIPGLRTRKMSRTLESPSEDTEGTSPPSDTSPTGVTSRPPTSLGRGGAS